MLMKQVIEIFDLLDCPEASGSSVSKRLSEKGVPENHITVKLITGDRGSTDFIRIVVPGSQGKSAGGSAPTLGILGRLGGLGARPAVTGFVSDGDGAMVALSAAFKLWDMHLRGDVLPGDVIITTHICPNAPTQPHEPVPFMGSPVDMTIMNQMEVDDEMDAILSIDTTRGNHVVCHNGYALSPTVKQGYILRVSEDLLNIMQVVSGIHPVTFPITTQDITPYGNGLHHINSILQPSTATCVPVVGVAITSETAVPGCATGASMPLSAEGAARFAVETAKAFTEGKCSFYDPKEFDILTETYGVMTHLQKGGQ